MRVNEKEMSMLTPIAKRILVKPAPAAPGKLIITHHKPTQFTIVAIGDEVTKVSVGNTIYLEKHFGVEIEYEGEKYFVVDESSILAKLD